MWDSNFWKLGFQTVQGLGYIIHFKIMEIPTEQAFAITLQFLSCKLHLYVYFLSDCSQIECEPGHQCEVFPPTGQPFCNPTCQVDNGGCDPIYQLCGQKGGGCLNNPNEPCKDVVECVYKGQFDNKITSTNTYSTKFYSGWKIGTFLRTSCTVRYISHFGWPWFKVFL